jgi:hypothetical protein
MNPSIILTNRRPDARPSNTPIPMAIHLSISFDDFVVRHCRMISVDGVDAALKSR